MVRPWHFPAHMAHKIAVLPGDGIGPEVMDQALRVLDSVSEKFSIEVEATTHLVGGAAIDDGGHPLPQETIKACEESAAILFGSVAVSYTHLTLPTILLV